MERLGKITLYNADCMDIMRELPDKAFDLAIVDPPYGISRFKGSHPSRLSKYGDVRIANDNMIDGDYLAELFRVSQNQIIFGWNHFSDILPACPEFIFWYKHQPVDSYASGELAWTSFTKTARCFDYPYFGAHNADPDGRIHPTQKPIAIYRWILSRYAKQGDRILDTHLGSGSSAIAAHDGGFEFTGIDIDPSFYAAARQRIINHQAQGRLSI